MLQVLEITTAQDHVFGGPETDEGVEKLRTDDGLPADHGFRQI
jgi:hypothetical protein